MVDAKLSALALGSRPDYFYGIEGGVSKKYAGDGVFNWKTYGALGDSSGALLSTIFGSLGAAQAVYPFVTTLSDSIDWAAIQAAVNAMYASPYKGGVAYGPPGQYVITKPIDIGNTNVGSNFTNGQIIGSGRYSTQITGNLPNSFVFIQADNPANGLEYMGHLSLNNSSTNLGSGALCVSNSSMVVENVYLIGQINALLADNTFEMVFRNCVGSANSDVTNGYNGVIGISGYAPHVYGWRSTSPYSTCLMTFGGNGTVIEGCGIENSVIAVEVGEGIGWAPNCTVSSNILTVSGTSAINNNNFKQFAKGMSLYMTGLPLPPWGGSPTDITALAVQIIDDHASDGALTGVGYDGTYRISVTATISTPVPAYTRFTTSAFFAAAQAGSVNVLQTEACFCSLFVKKATGFTFSAIEPTGTPTECPNQFGVTGLTSHSGVYILSAGACTFNNLMCGLSNTYAASIYFDPSAETNGVTLISPFGNKLGDVVSNSSAIISNGSGGAGTILNIPVVASGSTIGVGMSVTGSGVTGSTVITGNNLTDNTLTGTGGAGNYRVNTTHLVAATTITVVTGKDYQLPTAASGSRAGLRIINPVSTLGASTNYELILTFTELPGQAGCSSFLPPINGMQYDISDSSTATWRATIAGSGSNKVLARYNSPNWTVVG